MAKDDADGIWTKAQQFHRRGVSRRQKPRVSVTRWISTYSWWRHFNVPTDTLQWRKNNKIWKARTWCHLCLLRWTLHLYAPFSVVTIQVDCEVQIHVPSEWISPDCTIKATKDPKHKLDFVMVPPRCCSQAENKICFFVHPERVHKQH